MTRDGLIEVNETKETAERVSRREREADFSRPQEQPEPQAAQEIAAQNAAELPPVSPDASPLPLTLELPHRQDTATAERVIERIDAAQTRKASKKAAHKAQRDATVKEKSSRLQFTEEELSTPELEKYIRKSNEAADRLDAAKAAIPKEKKLVKERTFDEATGKAKTRLRFTEQEKPINGGKAHSNPLSRPAQEAGIFVHNKIHSVEKDNSAIIVIWYAVKYLVRMVLYLAREIEAGRLKFNGFYPDWAMPTFHIVRFLLYAFMIAMIYPYLPGSKSGVFQGISVFVGLIVSLGSSTVIGNIIAGLVITYMRPFKMGDRIKLNDTTGDIIEKTPLVTRIRTPKNEVVTVPNSFIMSSHTVNYSTSAREYGLIIHSEVSIGYDVPWRQVNQILIDAALNTPGVVDDPRPFVLETSLSDWYPVYQINAYIKEAHKMSQIYSDLHQTIQDKFNEAGIEIMSPHYMAVRDGNATTMPKDDLSKSNPADTASQSNKSE